MYMCEECNYLWEPPQRYIGDPETTHCPQCGSAEIEETKPQNLPKASHDSLLAEVLDDWIRDLETEDIYILPKLLEKMKSFKVKHFS